MARTAWSSDPSGTLVPIALLMRKPVMPMRTLVAGPAPAMKNSARADGGSRVRLATPPNRKSVIDETDMRNPRATTE